MNVNRQILFLWHVLCVNWVIAQAGHRGKGDQRSQAKPEVKHKRYKPHYNFLHARMNGSSQHLFNDLGSIKKSNKRSFIQRKVHIKGAPKGVIVTLNGQRIDPNTGSTILPLQPPKPAPLPGSDVPINVHVHVNKKYNDANIIGQRKQPIIITAPNPPQGMRPIVIPFPMPAPPQAPQPVILPAPLPPPPPAVLPAPIQIPLPAPLPPPPPPVTIPVPAPAPAKEDSDIADILQTAAFLNTLNKKEESRPKIIPVVQPVISPMAYQPLMGYPGGRNPAQGYPAGRSPNQGYPAGGNPNQGYPAGGNPNQGYPAGENPNQGYPAGGNPNQGYPAGGGNQNQGYQAGSNQKQAETGKAAGGGQSPLAALSGILPLLLPFNCRCGCERRCPDLCNLCKDVDEEIIDTLECCKSVPCPCVNAGAGVAAAGTAVAPMGGVAAPSPQQGIAQPVPASTSTQTQPNQMSYPASSPVPPPQPAQVPPLSSLGQLSPLPSSQPASAPPLPLLSAIPGPQPRGATSQPASAPPLQPASAPPLPSLSVLSGNQPPGPATQPASAPPIPAIGQPNPVPPSQPAPSLPIPSAPVLPGPQSPSPVSQPSGQVPKPLTSSPAPAPALPPLLPSKPEISPPKAEIAPPKPEIPAPSPPGAVIQPKPEIPAPASPGSVGPPTSESLGKGPATGAGTSTEAPGKEGPASELVPPPTDTGSSSPETPGTPDEFVAPPPDNSGPIKVPTAPVLPGESASIGPGPSITNPVPPPASTSPTNPSPPLPSLPLMKAAYPAPPPAPQVFIIKENTNPSKDPEESKSAKAINDLSNSFENAFKEALNSERRKGGPYGERRRGRVSQTPYEEERNALGDDTNGEEEEDDEETVRSHGGSSRDFGDIRDEKYTKINQDVKSDHRNDNDDDDDDAPDTDDDDDDSDYANNDDDNDKDVDVKADKEPSYDLDQPRHSHSLPYVEGDRHRDKPRRKTKHQSGNRKKYRGLRRYDQSRQLPKEENNRIGLPYDFNLYHDQYDFQSHHHSEKFPSLKTMDDEIMSLKNVQEDPLETTRLFRPRKKGALKLFKNRKERLKSPYVPRKKPHLPTSHDASNFAPFQDSASHKHGGHHTKDDHKNHQEYNDHHYGPSKTEMIPEDEITEDEGSTNDENYYSGNNEKAKSLKSLEHLLTSTDYERGSSHLSMGDTYTQDKKPLLNTVKSFKPGNHKRLNKHKGPKQVKSIAEDSYYSLGEESGQNEINGSIDDDDD